MSTDWGPCFERELELRIQTSTFRTGTPVKLLPHNTIPKYLSLSMSFSSTLYTLVLSEAHELVFFQHTVISHRHYAFSAFVVVAPYEQDGISILKGGLPLHKHPPRIPSCRTSRVQLNFFRHTPGSKQYISSPSEKLTKHNEMLPETVAYCEI